MQKFEEVGIQIHQFLNAPTEKTWRLIGIKGSRFVVCGTSGSGKTRAIERANSLLPPDEQIAESQELLLERDVAKAISIVEDETLQYEDSEHIGFNVIRSSMARDLEAHGIKVFWLDEGSHQIS